MNTLGQLQQVIKERAQQEALQFPDGRFDTVKIAEKVGCSRHTIRRILTARVARPEIFRPSPIFVRGLQRWFGLKDEADVWALIDAAKAS